MAHDRLPQTLKAMSNMIGCNVNMPLAMVLCLISMLVRACGRLPFVGQDRFPIGKVEGCERLSEGVLLDVCLI